MAWLSIGTCNEDLCNKMVQHGVLKEGTLLLEAFQRTDRGNFVPAAERSQAYLDRPFKSGSIHISAPHMYVTVLESLDLQRGYSFLNVGSGSGYLSCLASYLLGGVGICHGIEISASAVKHSRMCTKSWIEQFSVGGVFSLPTSSHSRYLGSEESIRFIQGNCFDINVLSTMNSCKYDRIYVGAGCPEKRKEFFLSMLADNGVLIVPINEKNQMVHIKRYMGTIFSSTVISNVHFAPLTESALAPHQLSLISAEPPNSAETFPKLNSTEAATVAVYHMTIRGDEQDQISRAHRAEIAKSNTYVKLPTVLWGPTSFQHRQFPPEFRNAVVFILMCTRRYVSHSTNSRSRFGSIPFYIWINVLTFASRDWFTPQKTEPELLKAELSVERQLRMIAESKLREAESAARKAERERDLYKMVILKVRTSHIPLGLHTEDFDMEDDGDGEEEEEELEDDEEEEGDEEDHDDDSDEEEHGEEEDGEDGVTDEVAAGVEVDDEEEEEIDMLDEVESVDDHLLHFEKANGDDRSNDGHSDRDSSNNLLFSDAVEGQAETSSFTREMSAPSLRRESQNVTVMPSMPIPVGNVAGSSYKETTTTTISTSFNSHTTNEFSISNSLGASWVANEVENLETTNRYNSSGYPSNVSSSRVGKHNRRGVINDAVRKSSGDSDSDSDDDSSSCVSFLSMGSESFSSDRDFSKKHRSLSEEFVTTDRMSLSISNIEEEGDEDDDDDDKNL